MAMNNLQPCPFCGGAASLIKRKQKIGSYSCGGTFYIHCKKCLISTQPMRDADSVIEVWNRRVDFPTTDVQEVIRCRDCKYYKESELLAPNKFCFRLRDRHGKPVGYNFSADDFCSRGERKD